MDCIFFPICFDCDKLGHQVHMLKREQDSFYLCLAKQRSTFVFQIAKDHGVTWNQLQHVVAVLVLKLIWEAGMPGEPWNWGFQGSTITAQCSPYSRPFPKHFVIYSLEPHLKVKVTLQMMNARGNLQFMQRHSQEELMSLQSWDANACPTHT